MTTMFRTARADGRRLHTNSSGKSQIPFSRGINRAERPVTEPLPGVPMAMGTPGKGSVTGRSARLIPRLNGICDLPEELVCNRRPSARAVRNIVVMTVSKEKDPENCFSGSLVFEPAAL